MDGEEADLFTTTLASVKGEGMMVGFYMCPEHAAEADDDASYFNFIFRSLYHRTLRVTC